MNILPRVYAHKAADTVTACRELHGLDIACLHA